MREILFRGQSIDRRKWYEGDLYQTRLKSVFYINYYTEHGDRMAVEVDPKTVGQYTGLNDCEGNKIFEGDIVEEGCNGLKGVVVWDNELGTYRLKGLGEGYTIKDAPIEWEVIGNIHDNPELLKGGEG